MERVWGISIVRGLLNRGELQPRPPHVSSSASERSVEALRFELPWTCQSLEAACRSRLSETQKSAGSATGHSR